MELVQSKAENDEMPAQIIWRRWESIIGLGVDEVGFSNHREEAEACSNAAIGGV